jgi:type VI secretion system protein ImpE
MISPGELFKLGKLAEAIEACGGIVKKNPREVGTRCLLAELLCFAGNLDRADLQLDAIGQQNPKMAPSVSQFRHLIRAEQARRHCFAEGRLPEFVSSPSEELKLRLRASILIREKNIGEAASLLSQAEEQRVKVAGEHAGKAFDDFRDLDDLTSSFFEVLTSNGKYYWMPFEAVESIEFAKPESPRDLLWRKAEIQVRGGPDGEVFFPVIYPTAPEPPDEQLQLGRATEWRGEEGQPIRGVGQRTFLVGDADVPILELTTLSFTAPSS